MGGREDADIGDIPLATLDGDSGHGSFDVGLVFRNIISNPLFQNSYVGEDGYYPEQIEYARNAIYEAGGTISWTATIVGRILEIQTLALEEVRKKEYYDGKEDSRDD